MRRWIALGAAVAAAATMTACASDDDGAGNAVQAPVPSASETPADTALLTTSQTPAGDAGGAGAALRDAQGRTIGSVDFTETPDAVRVRVTLISASSVASGFHGFHIHANDLTEGGTGCTADPDQPAPTWFVSADGHYAGDGQSHATHDGDLPSVQVQDDGSAQLEFMTRRFALAEVIGRAVILHAGPDNFGNVPVGPGAEQYTANSADATTKTAKTGNAGDRVACGLITES